MKKSRRAGWAIAALAFVLAGCAPDEAPDTHYRFMAMGTLVEVTLHNLPEAETEAAGQAVEALFHELHHRWDPWGEGELGQLNQALSAEGEATPGAELGALLGQAAELTSASGGRFDPAVGGLVRLWGFGRDETVPQAPPAAEAVRETLAKRRPLPELLESDGALRGPAGSAIDLGGFVKGVAVDRAVELLRERGIEHAIVNAGGDLRAIGRHGERAWRIGIRASREPGVFAAVEVVGDEAVFTSGDYERYFMYEGRRYHHVLDPRSGYPAEGLASVTVIHADAARADAAATALMVAGPREWPAVAAALGVELVMVVDTEGKAEASPAMRPRVRLINEAAGELQVRSLP